jgi:hypothetical protein
MLVAELSIGESVIGQSDKQGEHAKLLIARFAIVHDFVYEPRLLQTIC